VVIEAKGVTKAYGDKLLMKNLDFSIPPGAIVGVVGPNGAGNVRRGYIYPYLIKLVCTF
jgi:ABC-type multidrug transport system ATPase subunit